MKTQKHRVDVEPTKAQKRADKKARRARVELYRQAYECVEPDLPRKERSKREWQKTANGNIVWKEPDMSTKQDFMSLVDIAEGMETTIPEPVKVDGRVTPLLVDDGWGEPYELRVEKPREDSTLFSRKKLADAIRAVRNM